MLAFAIVFSSAMLLAFLTFLVVWRARRAVPYAPAPALRQRSGHAYATPGRRQPSRGF